MPRNIFNSKIFTEDSLKKVNNFKDNWKAAGVAVPVFSLKSKDSFGVGDFNDLKLLSEWCKKVGIKMIQILPINDTSTDNSWDNSYPYKAISTKALHPIYLNLKKMGSLLDEKDNSFFEEQKIVLNNNDFVDYPQVMSIKNDFFRKIFSQTWKEVKNSQEYLIFFNNNKEWLVPYAAFRFLSSKYNSSDFSQWEEYAVYDKNKIELLVQEKQYSKEIELYYFLQYHLDKQLKEAVSVLHQNGVALKGDLPIGIGRFSVEAWTSPELFNLDEQAGAPPDAFAIEGQNWGFPTYNWNKMSEDNYLWWKERLYQMSNYFDAYRIDHILGFFRIWEIPYEFTQGLMGHFSPSIPITEENDTSFIFNNLERFTKPYIKEYFLKDFFGDYAEEVKEKFLDKSSFYSLVLKPNFNTQRKIFNYFDKISEPTEKDEIIKKGLLNICTEVLFLKDKNSGKALHPRIALQFTHSYNELPENQKNIINRLYDDYFYNRNEALWRDEALKKLPPIIDSNDMLVCGEDLGMVPNCVPEVMQQLNILSLYVQRMPKKPFDTFVNPKENIYLSVDTTSTHDTSTIRGWWEENGELTNRFYREILHHEGGAPFFAEPYICQEIVKQHLHSSSMWVILPIQDYIAMDGEFRWNQTQREQINEPSNPNNKWCYKMHQSLESLNENQGFNDMLLSMIKESERI